jgi:hypothetical protein
VNGSDGTFPDGDVLASPVIENDDVFSRGDDKTVQDPAPSGRQLEPPESFEELPIEIRSLTERYVVIIGA